MSDGVYRELAPPAVAAPQPAWRRLLCAIGLHQDHVVPIFLGTVPDYRTPRFCRACRRWWVSAPYEWRAFDPPPDVASANETIAQTFLRATYATPLCRSCEAGVGTHVCDPIVPSHTIVERKPARVKPPATPVPGPGRSSPT